MSRVPPGDVDPSPDSTRDADTHDSDGEVGELEVGAGAGDGELPDVELERYDVGAEFSRGGGGRLLRAFDCRLGRVVAIKMLRRRGRDLEARFRREALLTARLEHPAIVPIHDFGRWWTGEPFYAMKLVSGRSLQEVITATPTLDGRLVLIPNLLAVADAIAYAHSQGVLHRDIKPANILVGAFGETMVIDWGIATTIAHPATVTPATDGAGPPGAPAATPTPPAPAALSDDDDVGRTMPGDVRGTPAYMAPEQARGEVVDERCDVYALAAVLYHLLTGAPPYDGPSGEAIVDDVLAGPPLPLETHEPGVPRELTAIVARGLARDRAARYGSAHELADDLRRFLSGQLVGAHRYSRGVLFGRWVGRHRSALAIAALAATALVVLGGLSVGRITRERNRAEEAREVAEAHRTRLLLEQGRSWLERDPTVALAWIRSYVEHGGPRTDEASWLTMQAESRAPARHVLRGWQRARFSLDGKRIAGVRDDHVAIWDVGRALERPLDGRFSTAGVLAFSRDGEWLAGGDGTTVHLWSATTGAHRTLPALAAPASAAAFAPDGRTLAVGDEKGTVSLIALGDGAVRRLSGHGGAVGWLTWSDDGRLLLSTGDDGASFAWTSTTQPPSGRRLAIPLSAVPALSPAGDLVAWGADDGTVSISDPTGGSPRVLGSHRGHVSRVAFSPDGRRVASVGYDRGVRVFRVDGGAPLVLSGHADIASHVVFSPDGRTLASTSLDHRYLIHDLATGDAITLLGQHARSSNAGFSPDGRTFINVDISGEVRVWDIAPPTVRTLRGHTSEAIGLAPRGPTGLASFADDRTIRLWDVTGATQPRVIATPPLVGTSMDSALDGRLFASAGSDHGIWTFDPDRGALACDLRGHQGVVNSISLSTSGKHVASGGHDRSVWWWDLEGCRGRALGRHDSAIWVVAVAPDASLVAVGGESPAVSLWNPRDGTSRRLEGHTKTVYDVRFSPGGALLASASADRTVRLWDVRAGTSRVLAAHTAAVKLLAFSPDGRWIASGADDGVARLWSVATGESRALRLGRSPNALRFTADSTRLVSAAGDVASVWSVVDGTPIAALRGHGASIVDLAVSPDGAWFATSSEDKTIRVWPRPAAPPVDVAQRIAALSTVTLGTDDIAATPTR